MKRIKILVLWMSLLSVAACGGSGGSDQARPGDDPEAGAATAADLPAGSGGSRKARSTPKAGPGDFPHLSAVRIGPERIFVDTDLNAEAVVSPPLPEALEFEYRWYVDNQEVPDAKGPVLNSGNFRKHQWIICEARALAKEKSSAWLKSDWVRIANSVPQVEAVAVDNFAVPGRFIYQLRAHDADNDELTFELVSPVDMGIVLDQKTGLLTWNLNQETVDKLGEAVDISLSVSDNDAQPTTGSLTLRFQKRTEKKNP